MNLARRRGIFGGTFDPVHYGHLRMAELAREALKLDDVLFVPNRISPFKTGSHVTPPEERVAMLRLALEDNPGFGLSTRELDRPGPSYTVDTVAALGEEYPDADWFFITGTDAVRDLRGWRRPEELLQRARFVVLSRPGVDNEAVTAALPPEWTARMTFVPIPLLEISGTDLRARIGAGKSVRYLMPPAVAQYARERCLYRECVAENERI